MTIDFKTDHMVQDNDNIKSEKRNIRSAKR